MLSPSALAAKAEAAISGAHVLSFTEAADPARSATIVLSTPSGKETVWLNPYTGDVLDAVPRAQEFNTVVKHLHSLDYFGTAANRLIEIVAGFALILVITGFYLWWPRRQTGGVLTIRGTPKKRVFWRDTHAVLGAVAGALIFFLALSGLPWSGWWGDKLHTLVDAAGFGYPAGMWSNLPVSDAHADHLTNKIGWTLSQTQIPMSGMIMGAAIGIDRAYQIAKQRGLERGFQLAMPQDAHGVYTASVFPDQLSAQRLVHIDQYTGAVLVDTGFKDYGAAAKLIEFGINVHTGQQWGRLNQFVMLATCFAIILSSIAAGVMWWKRRPVGQLGVPPLPDRNVYFIFAAVMLAVGGLFPLTGLAILVMFAIDFMLLGRIKFFKAAKI